MTTFIGVRQADGRVLSAVVEDDACGPVLARSYATALRATMLVSLGHIVRVGPTPRQCDIVPYVEAVLSVDEAVFQARSRHGRFHLFSNGTWESWSIEPLPDAAYVLEE